VAGKKTKICLRNKGAKDREMKYTRRSRAQSISEYSICVAIIILAIGVMQVYVKRGLAGRYADAADFAMKQVRTKAQEWHTEQGTTYNQDDYLKQYEPYYQWEELILNQDVNITEKVGKGGTVDKKIKEELKRKGEIKELVNYGDDIKSEGEKTK